MRQYTWKSWTLAILITLLSIVYQRMTGPTYPMRGKVQIGDQAISYKLLRSHSTSADYLLTLPRIHSDVQAKVLWRRYRTNDPWASIPLVAQQDQLVAALPKQPSAGKLEYYLEMQLDQQTVSFPKHPIIIRFKGDVPFYFLIPHILLMFLGMIFSNQAGILAFCKLPSFKITLHTWIYLLLGGLLFGPIVQYYAFGVFWSGFPYGHDLTDNKTMIAMIFWTIALCMEIKKSPKARYWVITAAVVSLLIYCIPHSLFGSELDYSKLPKP